MSTPPKMNRAERRAAFRAQQEAEALNPDVVATLSRDEKKVLTNKQASDSYYASEKAFAAQLRKFGGGSHGLPKPPATPRAPKVPR